MLEEALDRYFANFQSTRKLVLDLMQMRKHPIETLILLCARLDAMASDASAPETPRKKAFVSFLSNYGGRRDLLGSVSIGDLYHELRYHHWLLEVMIPAPGRLCRFSSLDDPVIHLFEDAGLPLTFEDCEVLLKTLTRILREEFRATPRQRTAKPRVAKPSVLIRLMVDSAKRTRIAKAAENLPRALGPLIESKKVGNLLYERFRCESIHGATMRLDARRFFVEEEVYWKSLYSEYYGSFELVEFPARFLLSLLDSCIDTYRLALLAKGKVPPDIHFHAFEDNGLGAMEFLDHSLLPEGGDVRLRIDRNR